MSLPTSYISFLQFRLFFPVLLDDGLAYQILDMQVAEKEVRGSPTHRQPKQCFCINQNQCILLLWSRLFRRIMISTGLISFQWIVHHLFVNTYMYLLDNNLSVGQHYPPSDDILNTPKIEMGSGNLVPILDSSSNQIYDIFLSKKQIPPTAKGILTDKYPDANLEWDKVYYCYE